MQDQWATQLYPASFGGVRLDMMSTVDDLSRALARYKYPHRNGADVEDMGGEERVTQARIIFFPRDGQDARAAFLEFKRIVDLGKSQTFVHPIFGEYQAKVGHLSAAADAGTRDTLMVECEFVEDSASPTVFEPGAGAPVASSVDEVKAISSSIDDGLVDVNDREDLDSPVTTTVGKDAVVQVTRWEQDDGLSERDVRFAAATLANQIALETDRLELATHVERYPLVAAFTQLHYAIRRAAEAFVARSPRLMEITVTAPTPLLVIAAQTYGADQARDRYEQLLQLNDIRTPGRVPRGTVLTAQSPDTSRRLRRPGLAA